MSDFLIYLLKTSVCLILFYLFMKGFLMKETFFRFNRIVLLSGIVVCLLLPFVKIDIENPTVLQTPVLFVEEALDINDNLYSNAVVIAEARVPLHAKQYIPLSFILVIVYFIGFTINLFLILKSIYSIQRLIKRGKRKPHPDFILIVVHDNISPFSWKKYIVISQKDYDENPDEILIHEIAHIKHYHSYDILFVELVLLFQWFNPAIWLLKRELKDIHEYQADMSVLKTGIDATKYQLLLVKKAVGASSYTLANSFNHSKLKKRITMMLREKSKSWARLKLLALLPLVTFAVYAFAQQGINDKLGSLVHYEGTYILTDIEVNGNFCFPISSDCAVIVVGYGDRKGRFHPGYDIRGCGKDTILAAFDGIVVESKRDKLMGNYIVLEHDDGLKTLYSHNSINFVKVNNVVKAGAPIGIIGNTGRSTGEHLHFEIKRNGQSVDPDTFINFEIKKLNSNISAQTVGRQAPPPPPLPIDNKPKSNVKSSSPSIKKKTKSGEGVDPSL
ncbi:MAG: M23/M56 family metallopeptidase [Dysgonomonas sp.]|nr:M23/M56 family metallopeptidase [Dysgonomonas sp.]